MGRRDNFRKSLIRALHRHASEAKDRSEASQRFFNFLATVANDPEYTTGLTAPLFVSNTAEKSCTSRCWDKCLTLEGFADALMITIHVSYTKGDRHMCLDGSNTEKMGWTREVLEDIRYSVTPDVALEFGELDLFLNPEQEEVEDFLSNCDFNMNAEDCELAPNTDIEPCMEKLSHVEDLNKLVENFGVTNVSDRRRPAMSSKFEKDVDETLNFFIDELATKPTGRMMKVEPKDTDMEGDWDMNAIVKGNTEFISVKTEIKREATFTNDHEVHRDFCLNMETTEMEMNCS